MNLSNLKKAFTLRPAFSEALIILFLFGLALFFRFHRISEFPDGLNEAWANMFAATALLHWNIPLPPSLEAWSFLSVWPLWSLLTRLAFFLFGVSQVSMLALPMLWSALGVPLVYFFFREAFSKKVGFFAALLLAVSYWDVSVVRAGTGDAISAFDGPLMTAFCWMIYRVAARRASLWTWRFAGIIFTLMVLQGKWYLAGAAFLVAVVFLGTHRECISRISRRDMLSFFRCSLGSYLLLIILAVYFLKISNPFFQIKSLRTYPYGRAATESRLHVSADENLRKVMGDVFVEAAWDPHRPGWPLPGHPWLHRLLSLMLACAFLTGSLTLTRSLGTRLILLWMIIPLVPFVLFWTVYAHHSMMVLPAVLGGCALGLTALMDWIEKVLMGWGRGARLTALLVASMVVFDVARDSYQIYYEEFPQLRDRAHPVKRLADYLLQQGVGRESLMVSNFWKDIHPALGWELQSHAKMAFSQPFLDIERVAKWPSLWKDLALEKGWRRIVYVCWTNDEYSASLIRKELRVLSKERIHTLRFRNGETAFCVMVEKLSGLLRWEQGARAQRKAILSAIPEFR